ncbi:hypothetical protein D3878_15765 [Noviherbaspirillum sedimenti]|uniref:Uncharacterized protein n=2 Tax=Noviherbaspirillum sedimenti TaxID=2320865 RepID=A0A3A3GKS7_9BURK|nr:hypothetical protein D3878_15765 [Noviherbaspirillum sedimenti]
MEPTREEILARLAKDVFNKRQHLLQVGQASIQQLDSDAALVLEAEYRAAELEYGQAKAAFARAMKVDKPAAG